YQREPVCDIARRIEGRSVMLLSGGDAQEFQESTAKLSKCFPANNKVETKLDLSPSGCGIINASIEQSEAYDQRLIDFFRNSLDYYRSTFLLECPFDRETDLIAADYSILVTVFSRLMLST